jgi:hypothetical protein
MKKNIFNKLQENATSFLLHLQSETTILINPDYLTAPSEFVVSEGRTLFTNGALIGERPVLLVITSIITEECVKIIDLEIVCYYDNLIPDTLLMQKEIESVIPSIPVKIRRSFEEIWDGERMRLTRQMFSEYYSNPER